MLLFARFVKDVFKDSAKWEAFLGSETIANSV
jgi:hypothetical protein